MELSFGEQIKILLKRKGLTIKELADMYEAQTGRPMSRQNLTQRLKRDNFPEQDMHIIAALLGYQVSVQLKPVSIPMPEFIRAEFQTASAASVSSGEISPVPQTVSVPSQPSIPDVNSAEVLSEESPAVPNKITFQIPEAFRKNRPQGDINPLTGEEYLTNTVRRHPEMEEFVQVYDQATHSWSDVREDYFWEFQDKKKQMLGKDYRAPILI